MVDNYILRANAREQLGNNIFRNTWLMMLVVTCMYTFISGAVSSVRALGLIVVFVLYGPLRYGTARTTLECVEGRKWDISHAFKGFEEDFGGSLVLGLLEQLFIALWSLLLVIPGIVKAYSYAMAFYIRQESDGKRKDAIDCISESRRMMDGHKWQLFCLDCSFIGWYLLGSLCLGIGVLFVVPYHQVARANFYAALKAHNGTFPPVNDQTEYFQDSQNQV